MKNKDIVLEESVKPCPKCSSTRYVIKSHWDTWIECKSCGHEGQHAEKLHDAIRKWNRVANAR